MTVPTLQAAPAAGSRIVRRARGVRLAAIVLGLGLGVGAAELAVRLAAPQASYAGERFYAADPVLGWRLAPDLDVEFSNQADFRARVRTDRHGFRVGGTLPVAPALLAVGDSFVFGWGVEADEAFVSRAAAAAGASVWNAGVPLYDVCQEADMAIGLLPELRPRAVVLGICLGNDESDALTDRHGFEVVAGALVPRGPVSAGNRLRRALWQPLLDRSHLLRLVRGSEPVDWLQREVFGVSSFSRWVARQRLTVFSRPAAAEVLEGSRRLVGCVERLRDRSSLAGAALVVVLVPDQLEVEPARLAATAAWLDEPMSAVDAGAPRERIAPALAALGIAVVDPLEELARERDRTRLFFRQDPHLTAAGHAAVARALAPVLVRLLAADRARRSTPQGIPGR